MAYNFSAEKRGREDLQVLHQALRHFDLFEFFPIEVSDELLTLGISIPFKSMGDPRFEDELQEVMTYLVLKHEFNITDLFTGNPILASNISGLAKQISR
ncbi:MAG: hypothetical protein JSS27_06845 [Planctomycetes bacterium]|nr:hypothetical protein [Planctomycetota bacterium]